MKFFCPITSLKFVGTISLGLLTGVSYSLSSLLLPSLAHLPSATSARFTLSHIQQTSTRTVLTLASISSISLITAYSLASPRGKHPYLLWTALVSLIGGQGIELYYNGTERFYQVAGLKKENAKNGDKMKESGYVDVDGFGESVGEVNGEKVESELERERWVQKVRGWVSGVGFVMGVVGVWGDGA